jgi:hypothetical protein
MPAIAEPELPARWSLARKGEVANRVASNPTAPANKIRRRSRERRSQIRRSKRRRSSRFPSGTSERFAGRTILTDSTRQQEAAFHEKPGLYCELTLGGSSRNRARPPGALDQKVLEEKLALVRGKRAAAGNAGKGSCGLGGSFNARELVLRAALRTGERYGVLHPALSAIGCCCVANALPPDSVPARLNTCGA